MLKRQKQLLVPVLWPASTQGKIKLYKHPALPNGGMSGVPVHPSLRQPALVSLLVKAASAQMRWHPESCAAADNKEDDRFRALVSGAPY